MKIGDLRITEFKHPDSLNQTVWNIEQLRESAGQYSTPGSSHWAVINDEPYDSKFNAEADMERLQ